MSLRCSDIQSRWIGTLKTKINNSESCDYFAVEPSLKINRSDALESHYLKPVIIVAPDVQFSEFILDSVVCSGCKIAGKLESSGWVDSYRYVHGIKSGIFMS